MISNKKPADAKKDRERTLSETGEGVTLVAG
jgi:hypothetical protein